MNEQQAMRMAVEALEYFTDTSSSAMDKAMAEDAITALRQALQQTTGKQSLQVANEPVAWVDLLKEAEQIVRGKFLWKKFIDGTPLANDIPCWMADFAQQYTRPQPAAPAWLPIETAPMDGTAIMVMRDIWPGTKSGRAEECNGHNTYVAAWWAGESAWVCYMNSVCDPHCPVEPTHWMPLPKPPMLAAAPEQKGN